MDITQIAKAVAQGVISIPTDFYLGLERTLQDLNLSDGGSRIQQRNLNDDARVVRAVSFLVRNRNTLSKIANIVIDDSLSHLPEPALRKIHSVLIGEATTFSSRLTLQVAISSALGARVTGGMISSLVTRLSLRALTGVMLGGVITQGIISRACDASRRLYSKNHYLWRILRKHDYDMLYFLIEEPLKPFIEMGELVRNSPSRTEDLLRAIESL